MIIPLMDGFAGPKKAPITWVLMALNLIIFLFMEIRSEIIDEKIQNVLSRDEFILTNSQVYVQFEKENKQHQATPFLKNVFSLVRSGDSRSQNLVSQQLALQDIGFLNRAPSQIWKGDAVALSSWRKDMAELDELRSQHPVFIFGLNARSFSWDQLLIYQFAHSGWSHFLFNMLFLLIFGLFLESRMKSYRYLQLYLLGGAGAGLAFLIVSKSSGAPLVGASGAIGALIGATLYYMRAKPTPFFAYIGIVKLPFWVWFFYFWVLVDLTGMIRSLDGLSTPVAHVAHIGGSVTGFFLAWLFHWASRKERGPIQSSSTIQS